MTHNDCNVRDFDSEDAHGVRLGFLSILIIFLKTLLEKSFEFLWISTSIVLSQSFDV